MSTETEPKLHRPLTLNRTLTGNWSARCRDCTFWTGYGSRAGTVRRMDAHAKAATE